MSYVLCTKTTHRARFWLPDVRGSESIGALKTYQWGGVNQIFTWEKNFRPKISRALDGGETIAFEGVAWSESDVTCWVSGGQSNGEGDWDRVTFRQWVTVRAAAAGMTLAQVESLIGPSTWVGGNTTGAGGEALIGPIQCLAALHAIRTRKPQMLVDLATGNQSILDLWGTNGEDGTYATQRNHANTYGGAPGAAVPALLGNIKRVYVHAQGEQDTHLAEHAVQPTHFRPRTVDLINKTRTDYASSQVLANVVFALAPDSWVAGQDWLSYIISETLSLHDPTGAETGGVPTLAWQYATADWQAGDAPHIGGSVDESVGWTRLCVLVYADLVARGIL